MFIIFLIFLSGTCVLGKNELYKGYRVYNIKFDTADQEDKFYILKSDLIDYWRKPSHKHDVVGQAMVPPSHVDWFEEKLDEVNVAKDIHVEDVYEYLKTKEPRQEVARNNTNNVFDLNSYYRYDTIIDYMKALEEAHSNSNQTLIEFIEAGVTDEQRPIAYLKVTAKTNDTETLIDKPVVVIEAGINPREWITVPAALNIVNRLIGNQTTLLDNLEWIVIPVLNPDGYEYTHTNLRLWTKSRSTRSNLGHICPGVNINRNFDIDWLFSDSSSSPCSHLYSGTGPFSEPESRVIKNIIEKYGKRLKLYISLQNNGGFISYPWQYERAASGMFRQHHLLGLQMISPMGDDYILDIGSLTLGDRASGTSTDYVMDSGIMYTFNVNVGQRGDSGVIVAENEIIPIAENIWNAISIAAQNIIDFSF